VMSEPIDAQIINGSDGKPEFAVLPYDAYCDLLGKKDQASYIPHEVVGKMVEGCTAAKAWREHFGLTQTEVATRMGITQAAYSQLENSDKLRSSSRRKIAAALGINADLLIY